jgi:hypothetical protein
MINAAGAGTKAPYVHSLAVDGHATQKDWISATDVVSRTASRATETTTMSFTLGARPDKTWGSAATDAPPSTSTGEQPAIAYLATKQLDVAPGSSSTAMVGVRNVTDRSQTVTIKVAAPSGLKVAVSPASFVVPAHGLRKAEVRASAPSHAVQTWSSVAMTFKVGASTLPLQTLTLLVDGTKGDSKLGLIGSTPNGPATGTITVHYRDGATSAAPVTLNDWAAGAGDGNVAVAKMAYRNSTAGVPQTLDVYVYAMTVPLLANRVVMSVTMPDVGSATGNGAAAMHVFGLALGS